MTFLKFSQLALTVLEPDSMTSQRSFKWVNPVVLAIGVSNCGLRVSIRAMQSETHDTGLFKNW